VNTDADLSAVIEACSDSMLAAIKTFALDRNVIEAAEQLVEAFELPWGADRMEDVENGSIALTAAVRARRKAGWAK
jgi:hypothetical protein